MKKVEQIEQLLEVDRSKLLTVMKAVILAASTDEDRPRMSSMLFDLSGSKCTIVCTDGHRMNRAIIHANEPICKPTRLMISSGLVKQVITTIAAAKKAQFVTITMEEKKLRFTVESQEIMVPLVDAAFPPYEQVIPKDDDVIVEKSKEEKLSGFDSALNCSYMIEAAQACKLMAVIAGVKDVYAISKARGHLAPYTLRVHRFNNPKEEMVFEALVMPARQ